MNLAMNFSDFYGDPDPFVQEMAHKLTDYAQQLQAGTINRDEYDDLVTDATTLTDVARAGKTVAELALLDKIIQTLVSVASAIPIP